ncbi:similar to Saccharomyces cerevisiae YJL074C SMC3 Subunit of the multiprotein cohesin complex required for sister chromatid cohesion in mitotic cells [Maudiozyma saulgeensis]|uniref:Structural maintenance of chromosomes protein n=1 Tax=Maudiozyma saulgeensis TaxID=1789683 RepID=A0A1X7R8F0_9SACH|nr:similar to Saccharomyces cerevisiae YJL074C SMC3 Subunit of the multiprotein cohesin complex required for sister chromatid cohesion in mitotic cells [Kazachstania saulgeensis]
MYIQRIIIKGFKTYRNETIIDDLSPHQNVIIGSNGSGKSNLFSAIRFVLSNDYSHLRHEERQGLIHQGSVGNSIMSASVEIVFHDPDGKIPLSSFNIAPKPNNEIHIRRTIGLKKDDHQVNDRNVSSTEVFRILESAGFSINNPYNIVPQGKIIALTNAKDNERLKLLEDVVGAKSFEIKLKASLKKMNETDLKMKEINKEMIELKSKLNEMNTEKIELEKYNDLERNRKVLQFTLYDRELNNILDQLEKIDDEYNVTFGDSKQYMQELDKREKVVSSITDSLLNIENQLRIKIRTDQQQTKAIYNEVSSSLIDLSVKITDLQKNKANSSDQNKNDNRSLEITNQEIDARNKRLEQLMPRFKELSVDEQKWRLRLNELQQIKRETLMKRSNYSQFISKEDRDKWINTQIEEQSAILETTLASAVSTEEEKEKLSNLMKNTEEAIDDLLDSISGPSISATLEEISEEQSALKEQYIEKLDERKELWRNEQKLTTILENISTDLKSFQKNVNETMSRDMSSGIASVREITEKLGLSNDAVFGTVGELIKVSEKYKVCAEVVGGNSLFHIIVDTDETASLLMEELNRMKGGRVTFIPLNRITLDNSFSLPPSNLEDSRSVPFTPLIKKIKYAPKFENAIQHIFGRTVVVKDLVNGLKLAKTYRLNAITLDGDRADQKGVLTGGYYDYNRRTRLDSLKSLAKTRKTHTQTLLEMEEIKRKLEETDSTIDSINDKMRNLANKKEGLLTDIEQLRIRLNSKKGELAIMQESLDSLNAKKEKITMNIAHLENRIQTLQADINANFDSSISEKENKEFESLTAEISDVVIRLEVTTETLEELTTTIDKLNAELESKLIPQKDYLTQRISESSHSDSVTLKEELDDLLAKSKDLNIRKEDLSRSLNSIQKEIDDLNAEKSNNEKILEKANSQQRLLLAKMEDFQKTAEKTMIKRSTLVNRREELQQRIREVGLLSEDVLNKFSDLSSEDLLGKLTNTNTEISKLTNVNKRALENYRKFNEKEIELEDRSHELMISKNSIQDLIEKLKSQKTTAVDDTFRKVSENFVHVFEKLVPMGTAKLIIQRNEGPNDDSLTQSTNMESTSVYSGVSISVSFNSKQNEQLHVEQLSGGQKTLCAIALILAIQMVDPAPFYLFDEIDAALDKQYRAAVASIIKELSINAQFICTTFRTDMLQVADKFFRVKYENKISNVVEIGRDDAIKFIRGSSKNAGM